MKRRHPITLTMLSGIFYVKHLRILFFFTNIAFAN